VAGQRLSLVPLSLLAAAIFCAAPSVSAHTAQLEWSAPPSCPDAAELRSRVERLLGAPLSEGRTFEARAEVSEDGDARFTLTLSVRTPDGEGTRRVRADTCEAALNVAAFAIALAMNPELANTASPPDGTAELVAPPATPTPPPASSPRPAEEPAQRPAPAEPPRRTPPPELWFAARAVLDTSLLPSPAAGFGALADVLFLEHIRAGLGGTWFVPQTHYLETGQGGHFSLWSLEAHVCWQERIGIPLAACPTFQFGRLYGEGRAVSPRLDQQSTLWMPGLRLLALPPLSRDFSLVAGATGSFPLERDSFVVNAGTVHEIPAFSLEIWVGVAVRAF
jgi:hypothetical protein